MKHLKLFEQFISDINKSLNEKASLSDFATYFPNQQNLTPTIHDKISSYSGKVNLTTLIKDLMKDLEIPAKEEKKFYYSIKSYIKYNDVTGELKKSVNINENNELEKIIDNLKTEYLGESVNTTPGSKSKRFNDIIDEWDWFTDVDEGGEEKLPKEYHDGVKKLGIKPENAIVVFSGAVGSWSVILSAAKKSRIKYVEVDDQETGESAIIFDGTK